MLGLSDWFKANKLSLNVKKSNYLIFKPKQRRQEFDLNIEINGHKMIRSKEVTFLGVILDENLSWKSHISHIASKISKSVGIIYVRVLSTGMSDHLPTTVTRKYKGVHQNKMSIPQSPTVTSRIIIKNNLLLR